MFQRHLRFLLSALLVGTIAWVPNGSRIRRISDYNSKSSFFHNAVIQNDYNRHIVTLHGGVSDNNVGRRGRFRRWRKRLISKKSFATALLAVTLTFKSPGGSNANAVTPPEQQLQSLRPGVSAEEAEFIAEGSGGVDVQEEEMVMNLGGSQDTKKPETTKKERKAESKKKKQETFDYGEDDEEFDDDDDDDVQYEMINKQSRSVVASSSAKAPVGTVDAPAAMMKSNVNMKAAYTKAAAVFVLPIVSFITVRGLFQEYRNQKVLEKAIDIMDAQKAEYFNVTSSSNVTDVEIEDALKGMKNETKGDNDEDDDDDDEEDDDDDEDTPPPRRRPKGGGDDDGGEGGSGGPSEEDLDRLKNLYNKS